MSIVSSPLSASTSNNNFILLTGGAGYIGSHTAVTLINAGYNVIVLDNLLNSSAAAVTRVEQLTGKTIPLIQADINDRQALDELFSKYTFYAVIHLAGLKSVAESSSHPLYYYRNNVAGSLTLCEAMASAGVRRIIFSSSATVYGTLATPPYLESMPRGPASSPYSAGKSMVEQMLEDLVVSDPRWSVVLLRYFNPIGAHPSGRLGESPKGMPNNLLPILVKVAASELSYLPVYGDDYPTSDGSCVRDYLHVMDLAEGHHAALSALAQTGLNVYNLGTGSGISVFDLIETFIRVNGVNVTYQIEPRRPGDLAQYWADCDKAKRELGWYSHRSLEQMVADAWRWHCHNPEGYDSTDDKPC